MRSFIQYITEAKNTHLEHLEDELWNDGSAGAENALRFCLLYTSPSPRD